MKKRSPTKDVKVVLLEEHLSGVSLRAYADRTNATILLQVTDGQSGSHMACITPAMIAQWSQVVEFLETAIDCLTPPRRFDKTFIEKPIIPEVGDRFPFVKPLTKSNEE